MNILAMDTAQGACSSALWAGGEILAHRFELMRMGHAEKLVPQAMEVMAEAGLEMADLSRLACTIGPGTFTGTRIALAAARGMALALKIPLVGVTTLEAVAGAIAPDERAVRIAAFDAKRGEVYIQTFKGTGLHPLSDPECLPITAAQALARKVGEGRTIKVAGTGAALIAEGVQGAELPNVEGHPDAAIVAEIAAAREPGTTPPGPLYLRAPDAKLPDPK